MNSFWKIELLHNTLEDWAIALGIILISFLGAGICQKIVLSRIHQFTQKTSSTFDDFIVTLLQQSVMPFIYILAFYFGIQYLYMPERLKQIMHIAILFVTVFFIIRTLSAIVSYSFQQFTIKNSGDETGKKQARGILLIIKIILWIIGIVFIIDNLGYNITTIVTGLGIGGIAIALASQAILGDLFSYLVIFFDKPFEAGDFIMIGNQSGVVEYIGIKTTRIRTLSGEQLIVSNTDLTNSRVQNFKRMERRRVVFSIGVTYDTIAEKLKQIPSIAREIIEGLDATQFDRAHFSGFGDFSLNFEIVYYIPSADYNQYMDIQQAVCLALFERFEQEKIEFAYPTQKVLLSQQPTTADMQ